MERKVDVTLSKTASAGNQITPEDKARQERRARQAEVLDRGVLGNKLVVNLKEAEKQHYEWPHKDDAVRMQALGFRYATQADVAGENPAMHDAGDGKIRIGDTVLMICDKETKEDIDAVKKERSDKVHAPKGDLQKEEQDFAGQADIITQPSANSKVRKAGVQDISAAIEAVNRQKTQG